MMFIVISLSRSLSFSIGMSHCRRRCSFFFFLSLSPLSLYLSGAGENKALVVWVSPCVSWTQSSTVNPYFEVYIHTQAEPSTCVFCLFRRCRGWVSVEVGVFPPIFLLYIYIYIYLSLSLSVPLLSFLGCGCVASVHRDRGVAYKMAPPLITMIIGSLGW